MLQRRQANCVQERQRTHPAERVMPDGTSPTLTASAPSAGPAADRVKNNGYIVGPAYDLVFFILTPGWWLLIGIGVGV